MAILALVLTVAWLVLVAGVRSYVHLRNTGDVPLARSVPGGSPRWWDRAREHSA